MKKKCKLSRTKAQTGNPNIPFTVEEEKAKRVLIIEKTNGATGSDEEGLAAKDEMKMKKFLPSKVVEQEMQPKLVMQWLQMKILPLALLMVE